MDAISDSESTKRKLEQIVDDKLSDKRYCLPVNVDVKPSNYVTCMNSISVLNSEPADSRYSDECHIDGNDQDINLKQICNSNTNDADKKLEQTSVKDNSEELNLMLSKDNSKDIEKKKKKKKLHINGNHPSHETLNQSVNSRVMDINSNNDMSEQTSTTNSQRKFKEKCKYGDKCYRLNDEHKAAYSHPGDTDYDLPDDRPECVYGINCYRKNQQHRIEYKHTSSKRKRNRVTLKSVSPDEYLDWENSEEESVDESEYEPSFIDDESIHSSECTFSEDEL